MKHVMDLITAQTLAGRFVDKIRPACARVEVGGSVRRKKPEVGDIEIVAAPLAYYPDIFAQPDYQQHTLNSVAWSDIGELTLNGSKQKRIILPEGVQIDLFIVTPPAEWGWKLLLATGSRQFNMRMVTPRARGGYKPEYLQSDDGAIRNKRSSQIYPTPEEVDVFNLYGMPFIEPENRI